MWICLSDAFLSIVANPADQETLMVRARRHGDLQHVFGNETAVTTIPGRDYQFRAFITRSAVATIIAKAIEQIAYLNFKGSVRDDNLHTAYMKVWDVMAEQQEIRPYDLKPRKGFNKLPTRVPAAPVPSLTDLERDVLLNGIASNPHYVESGWAWSETVTNYCKSGVTESQARGVLTSLKKKGLIESDGNTGADACVRLLPRAALFGASVNANA